MIRYPGHVYHLKNFSKAFIEEPQYAPVLYVSSVELILHGCVYYLSVFNVLNKFQTRRKRQHCTTTCDISLLVFVRVHPVLK